jgi:hypothetical protein
MIGTNIAPGWSDTVYGKDLAKMGRCLLDLKPSTVRMPWVNNSATIQTWQWCHDQGFDVIVIDPGADTAENVVAQLTAVGLPCYVEGVNETDGDGKGGLKPRDQWFDATVARQTALYNAVAGRFRVLSPSVDWTNEPDLLAVAPHDIVSCHRYEYNDRPATDVRSVLPATSKPIWITETGWPTFKKWVWFRQVWVCSEQNQSDWIKQFKATLIAKGVQRVMIYALEDEGTRSLSNFTNPSKNWGLYTYEGNPKIAATTLRG